MASWNHDGTQDPGPPPLMSDPLSGLVTGGKYDAEAVRVRVVEPAAPDIDKVREAMASVLDEDSELMIGLPPAADGAPVRVQENMGANDPDAGDGGEGVGPAADSTPAPAPPPPTPPAGIPAMPAARIPLQRGTPPRPLRRRTFSPGIAAVGLLLLVIGVLVIVMLASLIDTISSLFS
jgi:hypothetical protein